jgi:multidrug efflux pump subunit AcrB
MKFLQFLQDNKLFVHYLSIVVVIGGLFSIFNLRREARPNVNFNRVNITTVYPGASPSDIEELVIDPIEEKIDEVDGIEEYRSVSYVGAGLLSVKIDQNYPNSEEVIDEIRRKVSEVRDLPAEVEDPTVSELKADNIPVLNLALYGSVDPFTLKLETEKLKDFLKKQAGVTRVDYAGITDLQLQIMAKPDRLSQFDMTLNEIWFQLREWSKQRPGGLFEDQSIVTNLTIGEDINEIEKAKSFVLRSNDSGKSIPLGDVAEIRYALEKKQSGNIFGDQPAVLFTIVKSPSADAVETVDDVKKQLVKYQKNLNPKLNLKLYQDQSKRIRDKLRIVIGNALSGLVLVLFILIVFLDWRSALVTSIGIPIAILGGLIIIYFLGMTLNSLVVVGMIIVLGMLVDDAIVVCENIYAKIESGLPPMRAAVEGTKEISAPVISSVLTTVFAFLPIAFMGDIIGQFLSVIPITVVAMLAVSLLEALIVLPIHAEEIMRPRKTQNQKTITKKMESIYRRYIRWSMNKRWLVLGTLTIFFAFSLAQGKKIFERFSLFPAEGLDGLSVRIELPKNTPLPKTQIRVQELSQQLQTVSEDTFDTIYSNLGQVTTGGSGGSRQNGGHLAMINVKFTSDPSFIYKEKRIVTAIRKTVKDYRQKHSIKASVTLDRPGPPIGKPIQVQITSRDFNLGQNIIEQIKGKLQSISGVEALETDLDGDSIKYRLKINNEFAVSEGVDPARISRTIFAASTGVVTREILKNNEKVEILLGLKASSGEPLQSQQYPIDQIMELSVRNNNGQAVPIKNYLDIIEEKGPSSIQRYNGIRTITLFGEVDDKIITGKQVNQQIAPFLVELRKQYPNVKISVGGGERDRLRAVKDTMRLYLLAIVLIFMAISLTFNSFIYPFLVLTAIPMGISGVIWSLVIHGKSLSIMGIIGIVGLSGVVVNVSIIYLKFIQDRIKIGMPFKEAIEDAGVSRLRPIVMTTVSTLIGLLPTIYGVGGVDTFVQPIAMVLGWGLFVATSLTLYALPAILSFFTILDTNRKKA